MSVREAERAESRTTGGTVDPSSERVLVLVSGTRNGRLTRELLERVGLDVCVCISVGELSDEIERGGAAALVAEEVLESAWLVHLARTLERQQPWSDFPFVIFSAGGSAAASEDVALALGNVTFLDRPVATRSMIAAVRAAIRSRRRQYGARSAIEARDTFLAMLGHELRNPLGAVCLAVAALDRKLPPEGRPRELAIIDRQAKHLTRLVDDLLDVARVTHGKVALRTESINLTELLRASFEGFEPRARERSLAYELGDVAADVWIEGDRQRLEQVFGNLLTNAIKYTPRGGAVTVSVRVDQDLAEVSVADTGIGVAPDMLEKVFEIFAQADRTLERGDGGLGLGLALVRTLVELHKGSVEARSEGVGRGSAFVVRLPLRESVPVVPSSSQSAEARPARSRVLVVEDGPDLRELLVEVLLQDGHEVAFAESGPEGLEKLLAFDPDVAFVDVGLPGFDGLELARRGRSGGSRARLVALTGYGATADRRNAADAGFDEHLTKPVTDEDLQRAMVGLRRR